MYKIFAVLTVSPCIVLCESEGNLSCKSHNILAKAYIIITLQVPSHSPGFERRTCNDKKQFISFVILNLFQDLQDHVLSLQVLLASPCAKAKRTCHANLPNVLAKTYLNATLQVPSHSPGFKRRTCKDNPVLYQSLK